MFFVLLKNSLNTVKCCCYVATLPLTIATKLKLATCSLKMIIEFLILLIGKIEIPMQFKIAEQGFSDVLQNLIK